MHTGRKGMKWGQHIFTKDELKFANGPRHYVSGFNKIAVDNHYNYRTLKGQGRVSQEHNIHQLNKALAAKDAHLKAAEKIKNIDNDKSIGGRIGSAIASILPKGAMDATVNIHEDIARVAIQNGKRIADELMSDGVPLESYERAYSLYQNSDNSYLQSTTKYMYNPEYQKQSKNRVWYY